MSHQQREMTMKEKTITIKVTQKQVNALKELMYLGSEDHSLAHDNGIYDDDEQEEFEMEVENPAGLLLKAIEDAFN
jgi:hypothetical protein